MAGKRGASSAQRPKARRAGTRYLHVYANDLGEFQRGSLYSAPPPGFTPESPGVWRSEEEFELLVEVRRDEKPVVEKHVARKRVKKDADFTAHTWVLIPETTHVKDEHGVVVVFHCERCRHQLAIRRPEFLSEAALTRPPSRDEILESVAYSGGDEFRDCNKVLVESVVGA